MTTASSDDVFAQRDALLRQLEDHSERLLLAAQSGEPEVVAEILESRQAIVDGLMALAAEAPIPADVGAAITEQETELRRILKHQVAQARGSMGDAARHGKAALRYRRSR